MNFVQSRVSISSRAIVSSAFHALRAPQVALVLATLSNASPGCRPTVRFVLYESGLLMFCRYVQLVSVGFYVALSPSVRRWEEHPNIPSRLSPAEFDWQRVSGCSVRFFRLPALFAHRWFAQLCGCTSGTFIVSLSTLGCWPLSVTLMYRTMCKS